MAATPENLRRCWSDSDRFNPCPRSQPRYSASFPTAYPRTIVSLTHNARCHKLVIEREPIVCQRFLFRPQ